jgi:hypothetical protein
MSNEDQLKKIGGEYGKVRAVIDMPRLNAYLAKHVKAINTPVEVKQFKVRYGLFRAKIRLLTHQ